ncbi:Cdc42 effector protein 1-like [Scleropages formosus]|nr:cdc42 effector protein 1-like [Scleropages formosus]XP_018594038.1 cdc42 effector protein 1-like [Scleropages formosus]XP_018594039.1 cdc42 effector protein 1-like [Scleropages formosus]KPP69287.1 Cdc42 effector protein 1-like [Scleropages formosus]
MSLGKLPGLKGLVSSSQGKRRFKSDLSVDMISPPLGDFRHTMHVGRGGDVFGDTSFLSNHGGAGGGEGDLDSPGDRGSGTTSFFSRTLRHVRKTPARPRGGSRDLSPPPPPVSPIIKNAISLPQLNLDASNGCLQKVLFPSSPSSPGDIAYSYGVQSGFLTLPRTARTDRQMQDTSGMYSPDLRHESLPDDVGFSLGRSDSMTSFTLDLGPSLMSEVFALIDSPSCGQMANLSWMKEEQDTSVDLAIDRPATHSVTDLTAEPPLQKDLNGRQSPGIQAWVEDRGEYHSNTKPDLVTGSITRVEPGMEAERFQRAADVLARHYGGSGLMKRQVQTDDRNLPHCSPSLDPSTRTQKRAPYAYPEEEDEIKV